MVTPRSCLIGILAAVVLGTSGCAAPGQAAKPTEIAQTPTTTEVAQTSPTTETPTQDTESLAPPVSRPLVVSGLSACETVTKAQLVDLGLDPSSAEDSSNTDTASCDWFGNGRLFLATLAMSNVRGLESAYYVRDSFHYFEETDISGYPAVRTSPPDDWYRCDYMVGVGPDRSVEVLVQHLRGEQGTDHCALARGLLTKTVGNLSAE